ncbi:2-octaprenyl-6-methoxyphenol hydroxylase [Psychromonas sp. CNPT3]|uniref:2-octaprenyl-6-methoxyphenyl hydroxylase n=1 Tax=Psychromonas sp. CNPT3 TaxID=314282 RepID=UPI00006E78A0|nr:2-octaprenyl-6-methoxyphenyl hydroxylase [Psychromonas sp. CNPT3]AGH82082.1 2-octaprenyl-6-methoxyphenol hydroxylase [Psychromonas sp. CNPT3]
MQKKHSPDFDVDIVIIGAGISGCILAHAILKQSPALNVLLVDNNSPLENAANHPGFDARSIALSAGSCDILEALDLWSPLKNKVTNIDDIHIFERAGWGMLDLMRKQDAFGVVAPLSTMGQLLTLKLKEHSQLTRLYNVNLAALDQHREHVICGLQDGRKIRAKLCIGADGSHSLTGKLAGVGSQCVDYACSAIIANVRCSEDHKNRAFERFTPSGPIALLPLSDECYSLVWSLKTSELEALLNLDDEAFLNALQKAFGYRAGRFVQTGTRHSYALKLIHSTPAYAHRVVCIGNAAQSLHPVMGQGFNLGLRDVYELAQQIKIASKNDSVGSFKMLNQYWSARKNDQNRTLLMTHSLVTLFSSEAWPLVLGRNIALQAMSCLPLLAGPIIRQAKGQFNPFVKENIS